MTTNPANVLASVDLGSNSFRLQICENNNGQLKVIDSFKQMVRFAAGLDEQKNLSTSSQEQALDCLANSANACAASARAGARRGNQYIPRRQKHRRFPSQGRSGTGFPHRNHRRARRGAADLYRRDPHPPPCGGKMLVIDIGGGSTEFVIGSTLNPDITESLPLGCVTYSLRFFQNKITAKDFQAAISAARNEIQRISKNMRREGWDFAVGTSGSAKSIRDVLAAEMPQEADITYKGMRALAERIIEAGSVKKPNLKT
ncbi:exopolyphosphatase [Neisseria gonorrhoeae]|uniref:Exopolyphosphatase n=1 Tax=Neisseria gonorrhoeae TaxID=485 RepID=A0A378VVW0_NEIGO|nr:exopolyphosphatase [Neisseria gonorrhoeae]